MNEPKPITPEFVLDRLYGDSEPIHKIALQVLADLREHFVIVPQHVEAITIGSSVEATSRDGHTFRRPYVQINGTQILTERVVMHQSVLERSSE